MKRISQYTQIAVCFLLLIALAGAAYAQSMDEMDKMGEMDKMMPPPDTCAMLPAGITVSTDTPGVHCQAVSSAGIGPLWLANAGASAAVDVWGMMYLDAEVCFEDSGSITFMDATMSPRMQMDVEYAMGDDGMTCAHISRAGTVILMPGMMMMDDMGMMDSMDSMGMMDDMDDMGMMDDMDSMDKMDDMDSMDKMDDMEMDAAMMMDAMSLMIPLEGCELTAQYNLNFRAEPGGEKIGLVSGGSVKTAIARTPNWFKVEHDGVEGWISAHYINGEGDCG